MKGKTPQSYTLSYAFLLAMVWVPRSIYWPKTFHRKKKLVKQFATVTPNKFLGKS
jgi:hypothetical protein